MLIQKLNQQLKALLNRDKASAQERAPKATPDYGKLSFSQCGEDLIVKFIFDAIGVSKPSYMDIGAHHPFYISNTALFSQTGSTGINIEPSPDLFAEFKKARPLDVNLNIGISDQPGFLEFFEMSEKSLSTFSEETAIQYTQKEEYRIVAKRKIAVETISSVLERHFRGSFPDFLSLDVEGLDERILRSIDFEKSSPTVICVETLTFSNSGRGEKLTGIIRFLESKGYLAYADTFINTIFVKRDRWIR